MIKPIRRSAGPSSEQGFVIVAVLWLVAGLAALAMIFSVYLSNSARALAVNDTALQAQALVSAGVRTPPLPVPTPRPHGRPRRSPLFTPPSGPRAPAAFLPEAA